MAKDQAEAMAALGIAKAVILGISQGGMIAQYLAVDYPDLADKLILAVTGSRPNEIMEKAVGGWMEMARRGNYRDLLIDTAEKSYSERYLRKYRRLYPFLGRTGKPESFGRFLIQAASCLSHNAYDELDKIMCPTLVVGGDCDRIVGAVSAPETAGKISGSELFIYHGFGHGLYEEAKDFNRRLLSFLLE